MTATNTQTGTQPQHTLGPWEEVELTIHPGVIRVMGPSVKGACDTICDIPLARHKGNTLDNETSFANARLIAAAPEQNAALLPIAAAFDAWLTAASRATEGAFECSDDMEVSLTLTAQEWQACRAAIAKAGG